MTNPCINKLLNDLLFVEIRFGLMAFADLKTLYAKNSIYPAPNNFKTTSNSVFDFIKEDNPKATKVVCTMQPEIRPHTTLIPCFLPYVILCVKTKILSGPGEIAKIEVANAKDKSVSIIIVKIHIFAMS